MNSFLKNVILIDCYSLTEDEIEYHSIAEFCSIIHICASTMEEISICFLHITKINNSGTAI